MRKCINNEHQDVSWTTVVGERERCFNVQLNVRRPVVPIESSAVGLRSGSVNLQLASFAIHSDVSFVELSTKDEVQLLA
jgi:hypothetical protein